MSIKQKQVLGVTSIVVLVVLVLTLVQFSTLARTLLKQSSARADLIANAIFDRARPVVVAEETAYQDLREDLGVQSALVAALYSDEVAYAAIVDLHGFVVAHSDPPRVGEKLPDGDDLAALADAGPVAQFRAIYQTERLLEWRRELQLDGRRIGEIRVALPTLLARNTLNDSLYQPGIVALAALIVAVFVAFGLAQVVVRPIHVIRSGLSRLGKGDLGATLDLKDDEFKDLGDIFANVTSQLKAAIPHSAKRDQLLELSRRITALGRLTAGVAHEVKNPLNAMTIHLELLKQKLSALSRNDPSGQSLDAHVDIISREIRRLDDVVQGFLKYARPEELTFKAVSPSDIVDEVLKTLAVEANVSGVKLESSVAHNIPQIEADPGIFRQALLNLAKNAVQAMPDGGTLTIDAEPTKDGRVEIRVSDTGVGIAPENLAKIFDLYFTTKPSGTGIGLSLVYRTVQLHNGDIDVESRPGRGTTFVIKMPKAGAGLPGETSSPSLRAQAARLSEASHQKGTNVRSASAGRSRVP
jgi:signal transduction histidine kinase